MDKKYTMGRHPNSLKNLRPAKKGEPSRNPKGRPTNERCLTTLLRQEISKPCPHAKGLTWGQYLVKNWLEHAAENPHYFGMLLERLEGKMTLPTEGEVTLRVVYEDD